MRTAADLNPTIHEIDCNYAVVFSHGTDEAKEDLVLTIDRQGRIKNLPECCELGDCPEFCTPP